MITVFFWKMLKKITAGNPGQEHFRFTQLIRVNGQLVEVQVRSLPERRADH